MLNPNGKSRVIPNSLLKNPVWQVCYSVAVGVEMSWVREGVCDMGMGRRRHERQQELWVATGSLPDVPQHAFYDKLNRLLDESEFDTFVEALCEPFYADDAGRPGIPPGGTFGCCSWDISRGWIRNGGSRGAAATVGRCGRFFFWSMMRRRPIIRACHAFNVACRSRCTIKYFVLCSRWPTNTNC